MVALLIALPSCFSHALATPSVDGWSTFGAALRAEESRELDKQGSTGADDKADDKNDHGADSDKMLSAFETRLSQLEGQKKNLGGIDFGIGVGFDYDFGGRSKIRSASITDNIVRIDEKEDTVAGFMLETHYFFTPKSSFLGLDSGMWGVGPYLSLTTGDEEIFYLFSLGAMVGFKRNAESAQSFNIGIGLSVDPNAQVLGDGFFANMAPPGNETVVRYQRDTQLSLADVFSFSF